MAQMEGANPVGANGGYFEQPRLGTTPLTEPLASRASGRELLAV